MVKLSEIIELGRNFDFKIRRDHQNKLDVDPQKDDDASPMSTYRCMLRPT